MNDLPTGDFAEIAEVAGVAIARIARIIDSEESEEMDFVAIEEPLEIRVEDRSIAVVMRTPGNDKELAAGFLATEGIVRNASEILAIEACVHCLHVSKGKKSKANSLQGNIVNVRLKNPNAVDFDKLTRHVFTSSSCGICSKASIAAVRRQFRPVKDESKVVASVLMALPQTLAAEQDTFKRTGGLHACGLFDLKGNLLALREDVGRHNALDKIIGWALIEGRLPLQGHVLLLSGRTSFEMLQKALAAGISIIAAISAPTSLAVMFARDCGQTLVGFLRDRRMNVYAGADRIERDGSDHAPSFQDTTNDSAAIRFAGRGNGRSAVTATDMRRMRATGLQGGAVEVPSVTFAVAGKHCSR